MSETLKAGNIGEKGGPGEECARTVCHNKPAIGYNRSTGLWYCLECSDILNRENKQDAMRLYGGPLVVVPEGR
ncbi:MAG: hypothetical protein WC450_13180 [Candidatus Omnitrophota bacterium]|jgi:hypothetical protein